MAAAPPAPFIGPGGSRWTPSAPAKRGAVAATWVEGAEGAADTLALGWYSAYPLEGEGAWAVGLEGLHFGSPRDVEMGQPAWLGYRSRFEIPDDGFGGMDWGVRLGLPMRQADPFTYGAFSRVGGRLGGSWAYGLGLAYDAFQGAPPAEHEWTVGVDLWRPGDTPFGVRLEHAAWVGTDVEDKVHTDVGAWVRFGAGAGWLEISVLQVVEDDLAGRERVANLSWGWGP